MATINPRQLEAFYKVMKTGGVTEAANMMNVTQPAVSRLIKDFEFALNLPLFEREGRKLEPRQEAQSLYREVERIYLGMEHVIHIADNIRQAKNHVLRLGVTPGLSQIFADSVLPKLLQRYPDISVVMDVESTASITDMVLNLQYDMGIISGSPKNRALRAERLYLDHAVAIVAPNHPLAQRTEISLAELTPYRALLPGRQTILREAIQRAMAEQNITFHQVLETSMKHCCDLAAYQVGVAIVDAITASHAGEEVISLPLRPTIEVGYFSIAHPKSGKSALCDEIISLLTQSIHQHK